ncbi:MAG: hypothetical protein A3A44_01340 [Candidatus Sungbacteria bacterium RIFCSPLOWO2_01_FULL_60_25]|uniref:Uncharacterized protein n=1 Tax=Candidatus Sungbacteria bacterium RIFCSPLOWO2_01_FULL_60_25 TaxID=1802281 RepID=A0A1G2LDK3_9BACT|nr:MAG: hypothetical protein A3A44_01340 [Candidatus Sungbacteria bacterium RIFCSPLOWO2_01_FULL_60_25]
MADGIFGTDEGMPIVYDDELPVVRRFRLMRQLEIPRFEPNSAVDALEDAHHYFRMKAAQVLESEAAVGLLAELRTQRCCSGDALDRFGDRERALALAMLTAAGFCDVVADAVSITVPGEVFLSWIESGGGEGHGQAAGDSA